VRRRQHHHALADEVPPFVDELIQQLKAGRSLAQALRTTLLASSFGGAAPRASSSPLHEALRPLHEALAAGTGLEEALRQVRGSAPPEVELVVDTLGVLVHRGGAALPSLERLSDTLRSAQWVDSEVRAQAAQATASATVLAGLPALFVVGLAALDGRMAGFYLYEPAGAACLLAAAGLSYLAWWWMDSLVGRQR
jgi:tight adherence protein B